MGCEYNRDEVSLGELTKRGIGIGAYVLTWVAILLSIFPVYLITPSSSWAVTGTTTLTVTPLAPTGLTAVDSPSDEGYAINLSWTPSTSTGVTEQRIYRGTTNGGPYGTLVTTIYNNTTSIYTDNTGLVNGTTYYYVIRAFDGTQESGNSNQASAVPIGDIASATTSTITATSPVYADNISLSTTTVTVKDNTNSPVMGAT